MRQLLTIADLEAVQDVTASAPSREAIYRAVEALAQKAIGHTLFTVMRLHRASAEVERLYSSRPDLYPVGGRKQKSGTRWGAAVLDRGEAFIANDREAVRDAFADHALIFSLGIGAIMNVPIRFRGVSLGTMNLSHEAGWFREADIGPGKAIAALLVPLLLDSA